MIFSYKPRPGAEEAIYKLISDITISMKSADYLKMPECIMNEVKVELSEKERKLYDSLKAEMVLALDGKEIDLHVLSVSERRKGNREVFIIIRGFHLRRLLCAVGVIG